MVEVHWFCSDGLYGYQRKRSPWRGTTRLMPPKLAVCGRFEMNMTGGVFHASAAEAVKNR